MSGREVSGSIFFRRSGGELSGGEMSWSGFFLGGDCPGGNYPVGKCPWGEVGRFCWYSPSLLLHYEMLKDITKDK